MNLRLMLGYAAPYRSSLALSIMLMLAETGVALTIPFLGGRYAEYVLSRGPVSASVILLLLLALFALLAVVKFANNYLMGRTSAHILADLRVRIYDHLQALPLSFYHQRRQGDVLALITYETTQLATFISGTLVAVIPLVLTAAGAVALMFRIDPALALLVAALVPGFYLVLKILGRRLRALAQQLQGAEATAIAIASENLGMLPAIKTFTREDAESRRYGTQVASIRQLSTHQQTIFAMLGPAIQFIAASAAVLMLWMAGVRIESGQMNPSELVSFFLYAALLTRPVGALAAVYGQALMARGTLQRLQSVLAEPAESIKQMAHPLRVERGEIVFRDLVFAYPGRAPILNGLNLRVAAGETLAITGPNGCGKSTLAHLLLRLHEPLAGQVLVDGVDIATVSLHSLRSQIAIVPQHVLLFNGTVRDNIAFGRLGADASEIEHAAKAAQAHEFVVQLPEGYDTVIGDQGVRLSGGQRQRVALARALLKNPPILIFDEATAMFDPEAEKSFIAAFQHSEAKRTVILITHRPASLSLADRVVALSASDH